MQRRTRLIALMFVMLVAVLFRTVGLGSVPLGLDPDEALNGNQGFEAAQTHEYRVFYPLNNGREGLFINLIGVSESAFGTGLRGLRIAAAVIESPAFARAIWDIYLGRQNLGEPIKAALTSRL